MTNSREGWICPTCKRGVSPDEKHCDHQGVNLVGPLFPNSPQPVTWPTLFPIGPFPTTPCDPSYTTPSYPYQTNPYPYVTTCVVTVDESIPYPSNTVRLQ